jgi:hypothetical protein
MAEMTIRRFGVFSVAKMNAILWFIFGLIIGVIYGLFFIIFGAAMSSLAPEGADATAGGIGSVVGGVAIMVMMPLFYGVIGLIAGAIGALAYNLLAGMIGGIKFEIEGVQQAYSPPPPPQDWAPNTYPAQ